MKAVGQQIYVALQKHCQRWGPNIMAEPEKAVVSYPPRDRVVITENDLEINFCLIKEVALGCYEQVLHCPDSSGKEIPNLSEFEARVINSWFQLPRVTLF